MEHEWDTGAFSNCFLCASKRKAQVAPPMHASALYLKGDPGGGVCAAKRKTWVTKAPRNDTITQRR